MVPHCPQKVNRMRMLHETVSENTDLPLAFCSSCMVVKSLDPSFEYKSYCFGQGKGFLSVNISKN